MELRNSLIPHIPSEDFLGWRLLEKASVQLASTLVVLRAGLCWIFNLGIQSNTSFYQAKNLALINRVSFVSLLLALPGSFLLLLAGFDHTFTLLLTGISILCLILALNGIHRVVWGEAAFAFSPAVIILTYTLVELSSGGMDDPLTYILAHQGLCLAFLLPIMLYGYESTVKWAFLGLCVVLFLFFDVLSAHLGGMPIITATGMSQGLFSILSVLQYIGLATCVLYVQGYSMNHEQKVRQSNENLQRMAIRDGMTGLFNRSFMEGLISDAINRSNRSNTPLSLLMIDVDTFKQVNDTYGHNAGDEVLKHLTRLLEGNKRSTDYLSRWGGDELVLLLTDTNLQGAANMAEKLRNLVDSHSFPYHHRLTISLGAAEYHPRDSTANFISRADAAMYHAKRAGRNQVGLQ